LRAAHEGLQVPGTAQSGLRVLVIDDDPEFCELMGDALGKAGYEVITRTAIDQDLGSITRLNADALIVDLLLRESVGGWTLIRVVDAASVGRRLDRLQNPGLSPLDGLVAAGREPSS
jgi:CheY-like chemotaxis protein